jgi:coenzyme F420-reducing hydrogenase beta subunit
MRAALPTLSPQDVIYSGCCIGCGSCAGQTDGIQMRFDRYGHLKPAGAIRQRSQLIARTCPFSSYSKNEDSLSADLYPDAANYDPNIGRWRSAYIGSANESFRLGGSSGGMVTWVAAELLQRGLVDGIAHVVPVRDPQSDDRFFKYSLSRSVDELRQGAHSRYYPTDISHVIREIRERPGRYAITGVPCVIKAVNLIRQNDSVVGPRIAYTLGLFCGHMKSARFVESFAWQLGVPLEDVTSVEFRKKDPSRPANWYRAKLTLRDGTTAEEDWWHLVDGDWGAGFFMNNACNYCDDVIAETADISFGDAWVEPYTSDGRGTNVVVIRSREIDAITKEAIGEHRLSLAPVDAAFVVETQAAGYRQRREGLAYRLTRTRDKPPPKRVAPSNDLPRRRKLIYRMRYGISRWSDRIFWAARLLRIPQVYTTWAKGAAAVYHALTYSRGWLGRVFDRVGI